MNNRKLLGCGRGSSNISCLSPLPASGGLRECMELNTKVSDSTKDKGKIEVELFRVN